MPETTYIVSASEDKTLKIWDYNTYKLIKTLEGHSKWISSLTVIPD